MTILIGLPSSGKSTLCSSFSNIISSDIIKKNFKFYNGRFDEKNEHFLWKIIFSLLEHNLARCKDIVVDSTGLSKSKRLEYIRIADKFNARKKAIIIRTAYDIILKRNLQKDPRLRVPFDKLIRLKKIWDEIIQDPEKILLNEGFDEVSVINYNTLNTLA